MACMEATGGYPPEIVDDKGRFGVSGMQMEVSDDGALTGKFRVKRPAATTKPRGSWPEHWVDPVHEFDGHGIEASPEDLSGEAILATHVSSLYV